MSRLIDAENFKVYLYESVNDNIHLFNEEYGKLLIEVTKNFLKDIDEQPTVEAEPIRHGEWMEQDENDTCFRQTCNICGKKFRVCGEVCGKDNREVAFYCPGCGARMDGAKCG